MNIQGIVWNCRGLRKRGTSTFLKELISQYQFHFIGLQETMMQEIDESVTRKFDPNNDYLWLWNPSKGKSGGIIVGVKVELSEVGSFKQGEYMIQLNLWDRRCKLKWNLIIVCGDAQEEGKLPFLSELSSFCSTNFDPFLIGGISISFVLAMRKTRMEVSIDILTCLTL